jgi:type IV secretory pathway TraG/TraD family ATPase VirD4
VKTSPSTGASLADKSSLRLHYPCQDASLGGFRVGDIEIGWRDRLQHTLIFGPTGAGKGVGVMVPNLIRDMHAKVSSVFSDKKHPETFNILSKVHDSMQRTVVGYDRMLACFSPFDKENTVQWNPINEVRTSGQANAWAYIIQKNSAGEKISAGSEGVQFYRGMEKALLQALILFVNNILYREKKRNNLNAVLKLLDLPQLGPKQRNDKEGNELQAKLFDVRYQIEDEVTGELVSVWSLIKKKVSSFFQLDTEKILGVILSLQNRLAVFDIPSVAFATAETELCLQRIGEEPITLVLGVPSLEEEQSMIMTALFWEGLIRNLRIVAHKSAAVCCPVPVFCYLDEAGNQGYFKVDRWLTEVRSYLIGFILAFQSAAQIEDVWGIVGAKIIMDNCKALKLIMYGCGADTAEYFVKSGGKVTIEKEVETTSQTKQPFALMGSRTKGKRQTEKQEDLLPIHIVQSMATDDKESGMEFKREYYGFGPLVKDAQDRRLIESIRALCFLFYSAPAFVELVPFYQDQNINRLINDGKLIPLREKLGRPATKEEMIRLTRWDINEKLQPVAVVPQPVAPPPKKEAPLPPKPRAPRKDKGKTRKEEEAKPVAALCPICNQESATLMPRPDISRGGKMLVCSKDKFHRFDENLKPLGDVK